MVARGGARPKHSNTREEEQWSKQPRTQKTARRVDDGESMYSNDPMPVPRKSDDCVFKVKDDNVKLGFLDKPRSQVILKQKWPHMNQNPRYVTSPLTFNQLNFCQFVGGEVQTIIHTEHSSEALGRLRVLSKIAYLYDQCRDWEKARNVYFAIVSSIEEGESSWSNSFGHYDIMCPPRYEESGGPSSRHDSRAMS